MADDIVVLTDISQLSKTVYDEVCRIIKNDFENLVTSDRAIRELYLSTQIVRTIATDIINQNPKYFYITVKKMTFSYSTNYRDEHGITWCTKISINYLYSNDEIETKKKQLTELTKPIIDNITNSSSILDKIIYSHDYCILNGFIFNNTSSSSNSENILDILQNKEIEYQSNNNLVMRYVLSELNIEFYPVSSNTGFYGCILKHRNYYCLYFTNIDNNNIHKLLMLNKDKAIEFLKVSDTEPTITVDNYGYSWSTEYNLDNCIDDTFTKFEW